MNEQLRFSPTRIVLTVTLPFALGHFLSYLYRNVNAVIADDLTREAGLDATGLGLLTAAYFLSFALFQIPLGMLLDRFGPRRVQATLLLVAAVGALVFSFASDLHWLTVGRAFIGIGVAGGLMSAFKANVMWWPVEKLPSANAGFMALGSLGALAATKPVEQVLAYTDWRGLFLGLAVVTVMAAGTILTVVPERPGISGGVGGSLREALGGVRTVLASRVFWRLAPLCVTMHAALLGYQGLWAGPWIRDVERLDRAATATALSWTAVALIVGFLSLSVLVERARRVGIAPAGVMLIGAVPTLLAQALLLLQLPGMSTPLWVAFALFGTTSMLPYAVLQQHFPQALAGRVGTAMNLLVFSSVFGMQSGVGWIIDLFPVAAGGGYAVEGHRTGLAVVLGLQILALAWFLAWRRSAPIPIRVPPAP